MDEIYFRFFRVLIGFRIELELVEKSRRKLN